MTGKIDREKGGREGERRWAATEEGQNIALTCAQDDLCWLPFAALEDEEGER